MRTSSSSSGSSVVRYRMARLAALVALGLPLRVAAVPCALPFGDLDGSGTTTVVDVQCGILVVLWTLADQQGPPPTCASGGPMSADVSCDAHIDVTDVQMLVSAALDLPWSADVDADGNGCPDACEVAIPPVQWVGDTQWWQGALRRYPGDPVYENAALTVTTQTYPAGQQHVVTLHYTTDNYATIHNVPFQFDFSGAGPFGNNNQWYVVLDPGVFEGASTLVMWVEASDGISSAWDSNYGSNYSFPVVDPSVAFQVSWGQAVQFEFDKCWQQPDGSCYEGWSYAGPADNPLVVTPETYQAYGAWPHPGVEFYVAGLTDLPDGDPLALFVRNQLLRVEVLTPLPAGDPAAQPAPLSLDAAGRNGNNWLFEWILLDTACGCPPWGSWPALGQYSYTYRISLDAGEHWTSFGDAPPPDGGSPLVVDWQVQAPAP